MGKIILDIIVAFINWLPRKVALRLGAAFGSFLYSIVELTRFRGAVRRNIRNAFPDRFTDREVAEMARQHGRDLITTLVEAIRFRELPELLEKGIIQVEGLEHLEQALAKGKGAILLSAHMGNWEMLFSIMGLLGYPVHAIVVKQSNELINDLLVRERERFGSKIIYLHEVNSQLIKEILTNNGILLLLADQHNYGGKVRNIIEFFGKPVSVAGGPVAYSQRFGAPLIPAYTVREPGDRHRIIIEPPLKLIDTGNPEEDFLANCRLYYQVYERWIRKHPSQWMWSHERWEWLDENLQPRF
ncbi:MAG: lysophospholipid acyltransferase family protein [Firmicutes bacterium]|nr:lysophospholipid acyltransferase family protein [Bacillota bacterium]